VQLLPLPCLPRTFAGSCTCANYRAHVQGARDCLVGVPASKSLLYAKVSKYGQTSQPVFTPWVVHRIDMIAQPPAHRPSSSSSPSSPLPLRPLHDLVAAVLGIFLDAQISCEEAIGLLSVYRSDGGEVERLDLPEHPSDEDAVVFGLFAGIAVEGEGAEFRKIH